MKSVDMNIILENVLKWLILGGQLLLNLFMVVRPLDMLALLCLKANVIGPSMYKIKWAI